MEVQIGQGPLKIVIEGSDMEKKTVIVYLFSRQKAPKKLFICNRPLDLKSVIENTRWEAAVCA